MKKLSKEQANALRDSIAEEMLCGPDSIISKIIDSMTEKTPEEELAEYKCPYCGNPTIGAVHSEYGVICSTCLKKWQRIDFFGLAWLPTRLERR